MKKAMLLIVIGAALTGCADRAIWNDNGEIEEATNDREVWDSNDEVEDATDDRKVWDSNGKMDTGGRKIWNDADGDAVIE